MDWSMRTALLILWIALVLSAIGNSNGEERIVCYYTNWSVYRPGTAKYSPQNINPYLCTHLIYAFGGFTKDNTLKPFDKYQDIEKGGYAKFTGLKTYNKNLKTMLAIGGWNEGSSRFSSMVADPSRRRELVKNAVKFLRQNHFDGLDLDWEYPAFRDGGKPRDRNNYADLVQELREEFERESSKTGRPRLLLSMAIPAGIEYLEKGYDLPRLNEYLDFFNLLSYDYHSAFEPAVNHHSPLYGLEEDNEYNYDNELTIDYTVKYLLNHDVTPEKLVLGIPTYGRSYTLYNADANEIGAPADGPGEEGDATREKGYLAYYEICENIAKSDEWQVVQPNEKAMGPYAFRENQWVGYDDENIVRVKALYVKEKKLGGIMFWAIDNDDFRGKCHGRPYPLIEAAKEALLTGSDKSSSEKTKAVANRKKTKPLSSQRTTDSSNDRKYSATQQRPKSSSNRKRPSSSRSSNRQSTRNFRDEEENDEVERNTATNRKRPGNRAGGRRKPQHTRKVQKTEKNSIDDEKSLSNSLTTPEPPTTPDPGSDFKCEEDGFFPHPRDCKKYFWCLDAGPGGLGIVAHQFTCPSGLVFNKVSDSCDYPRNVICPKVKTASATTAAPTTSTTVRTTTKRRTTTLAPESEEEEYEYEDDIEEEEELPVSTTAKPLLYKTISRSRPTTTTTTTEAATTTRATATTESPRNLKDVASESDIDDTEDPRVLKELIDLIKKAGGIEQLEKQLHLQEKNSDNGAGANKENIQATPASISRSLYEKVLNRQANRLFGTSTARSTTSRATNSRNTFQNGPGRAQFEGLDEVPEVKGLRRNKKPQYVTIERQRSSTPTEEEDVDEDAEADLTDTVSSDNESISTIQEKETQPPLRRVTPSYVNIRRARPTTPATENDVEEKEEVENSQIGQHSTSTDAPEENSQESTSQKSRYTNVQRFRSTTLKSSESGEALQSSEYSVENLTSPTFSQETTSTLEPQSFTTLPSSESTTKDSKSKLLDDDVPTISTTHLPATEAVKSVENSVTELLLTTFPAPSSPRTTPSPILRPTTSAVSPPRPFGFPRRTRPTSTTTTTTPVSTTSEQTRAKVSTRPTRNFVRSSNAYQNRVRTRTRSTTVSNDIISHSLEENSDNVTPAEPEQQTINNRSRFVSRRGGSRFSATPRATTEENSKRRIGIPDEIPTSTFPSRRRGRPTSRIESPSNSPQVVSRRRRPTDSRIIRISTENPNLVKQSKRLDIEKDDSVEKITKIEVFKGPVEFSNDIVSTDIEKETIEPTTEDESITSTTVSSLTETTESIETSTITMIDETIATTADYKLLVDNNPEPVEKDDKKSVRRRVLLRKRPIYTSTTAEPITIEGKRRRKILKRVRPHTEESSKELPTAQDGEVVYSSRYKAATTSSVAVEQEGTTESLNSPATTEIIEQTMTPDELEESTIIPTTTDIFTTESFETTLQTEIPQADDNLIETTTNFELENLTTTTTPTTITPTTESTPVNLEIPGLPTLKQLLNANNNTATSPIVVEPTSSYKISNSLFDEFENNQLLPEIIDSDGLKLPVKILDDGSGEVNITYPFAVLNLPRGVINANITSTVLKIEVINSEELKNESHEKAVNSALPEKEEIQKKEVTNVRNFRRRYRDRQETRGTTRRPSNRRRNERRRGNTRATIPNDSTPESSLKFSSTTLMTTVDDFLRTSVKPTTLRGSSIPFPKSQGPPRGFFITKSLDDVPETTEKLELNRATTEMPTTATSFGEVTTGENEYANTESISNETTHIVDSASNEVDSSTLRGDTTEVIDNFLSTTLRPVETTLNENETEYIDTTSTTIEPELTTSTEAWMEITTTVDAFQSTTDLTALPVINSLFETTTYDNVDEKLRESNFAMGESSEKYLTTESSDVTVATTPVNLSTLRNEIFDEPNDTTQSISYATTEKIKNEDITKMTTEEIPITTDAPQFVSITSEYNKTPVSMNLSQSVEHTSTKIPSQSSSWQNSLSTSVNLQSATADTSTTSSTTPITPQQPIEQRKRSDIKRSRGKIRYGSQTTTSISIERKSRPLSAYRRRTTTTTHSSHNETDNAPITPDPIISSSMRPTRRLFNRGRGKARGRELAISTTEKSSSASEIVEDTTENGEDSGVNELTPESSQSQPIDDQSLAESSHSDILGEVGGLRHSGIFVRRPGTFHRPSTTRSSATVGASTQGRYSSKFTTPKTENYDQNGRAQEIAVSLIDPSVLAAFETGKDTSTYRGGQEEFRGLTETPIPKTTTQSRRRQRPRVETRTEQRVTTSRPRRPAIIDYDYYVDEEVRIAVKPELKDKIYVTSSGRIGCLDQGTFAHPFSCKKFITCARVVGGQVVPTEYSCPNKLSFDPVGGICNWSAGLGCKETLQ